MPDLEGGLNDLGDGLGAIGEHQGHLGHGGEGGGPGVKEQSTDAVAGGSSAGLTGQDEAATSHPFARRTSKGCAARIFWGIRCAFFEPGGQTLDLGGFTGTVETFESDKQTARHEASLPLEQKH